MRLKSLTKFCCGPLRGRSVRGLAWGAGALLLVAGMAGEARAGLFTLPHFTQAGEFSLGLEPELTLTSGAGLAFNGKFTYGVSYLSNLMVALGSGGGPRRFRIGSAYTFDFFPDIEGQPGIGLALQGYYYRLEVGSRVEFSAVPYIHKSFLTGSGSAGAFEPFLGVPFGAAFLDGKYKTTAALSLGCMFQTWEPIRWVIEVGVPISNGETYVSGGIAYFH